MAKSIRTQLGQYIEELKQEKERCDQWDTEEMIGASWAYEQVIEQLENMLTK